MKELRAMMLSVWYWDFYDEDAETVANVLGRTPKNFCGRKVMRVPQSEEAVHFDALFEAGYHVVKTAMLCDVYPTQVLLNGGAIAHYQYQDRYKPIQPFHRIYVRADGWSIAAATHDLSNWAKLDNAAQKLWDYKGFWVLDSKIHHPKHGCQPVYKWVSLLPAEEVD